MLDTKSNKTITIAGLGEITANKSTLIQIGTVFLQAGAYQRSHGFDGLADIYTLTAKEIVKKVEEKGDKNVIGERHIIATVKVTKCECVIADKSKNEFRVEWLEVYGVEPSHADVLLEHLRKLYNSDTETVTDIIDTVVDEHQRIMGETEFICHSERI